MSERKSEREALAGQLAHSQNEDGGWPYRHPGTSWTEPTAFSVLALQAADPSAAPVKRGLAWLLSKQSRQGGWSPKPQVTECTSVTSIAAFALLRCLPSGTESASIGRCVDWIANQVYSDGISLSLLLARALNLPPPHAPGSVPWYPGTAGWVIPTATTAITLARAAHQMNRPDLRAKAHQCCTYLLSRRCVDEGWNHGGSNVGSENAGSYPETTGLALLALRAAALEQPASALALAKRFADHPESVEGLSWIQMALSSPNQRIADPQTLPPTRTNRDIALRLLALSAAGGKNVLLADN